jgi:hypothetical protein
MELCIHHAPLDSPASNNIRLPQSTQMLSKELRSDARRPVPLQQKKLGRCWTRRGVHSQFQPPAITQCRLNNAMLDNTDGSGDKARATKWTRTGYTRLILISLLRASDGWPSHVCQSHSARCSALSGEHGVPFPSTVLSVEEASIILRPQVDGRNPVGSIMKQEKYGVDHS